MRTLYDLELPTSCPSPPVKWLGGKTDLADQIIPLLPHDVRARRWFEPFAGGAAMFFRIQPYRAVLSDNCTDLIGLYEVLQHGDLEAFYDELGLLAASHRAKPREHYEAVRRAYNETRRVQYDNEGKPRRAAWFLYLNRTGFNGLHRVNQKGEFNVPFGDADEFRFDVPNLTRCGSVLLSAELHHESFEGVLSRAQARDVVYFDPPFHGTFTGYSGDFDEKAQVRLRDVFRELDQRGVVVVLSSSETPLIRELYQGFEFTIVRAGRVVGARGNSRGSVDELVIRGKTR